MSRYCDYYRDHEHNTEKWLHFKEKDNIIAEGEAPQRVSKQKGERNSRKSSKLKSTHPGSQTINMIVRGSELGRYTRSGAKRKMREIMRMYGLQGSSKPLSPSITFVDEDGVHTSSPHHDTLVI